MMARLWVIRCAVRLEHRHEALRVAGAIGVVLLLALEQVDGTRS